MNFISPGKARDTVRAYPFKKGQSELKKALARLFRQDRTCDIPTVDGLKLHLPNYRGHKRIFWWFEEVEAALQFYIRRFLPVGAHVIDVGAASGIIGLLAARLKGAEVKMVEAYPQAISDLQETLRLNPGIAPLCRLYGQPCALGPFDPRFESPGITIEQIIRDAGWSHVDLLKVDVDGPDFEVLSSAGPWLRPDRIEAIYIETEIATPADIRKLAGLGYAPYATKRTHLPDLRRLWINQTERHHYHALDLEALTQQNVPSNVLFLARDGALERHFRRWCA
jgi:FkbM family methyltransferase